VVKRAGPIVIDVRTAKIGGALHFLAELPPRLARMAEGMGYRTAILGGPPAGLRERLRRRLLLARGTAILHAGNRATLAPGARQVVCVQNRLLLPGVGREVPLSRRTRIRQLLLVGALPLADALVVPSRSMVEPLLRLQNSTRCARAPIHVIPHGRPQWPAPLPRPMDATPRLLYVSHVARHKNFPLLAGLLVLLHRRLGASLPVTLTASPGEEVAGRPLREWFSRSPTVNFIGAVGRAQLPSLYANHDILVFPSLVESFGFPLLEAMVMGMPIVASDREWAREVCGDAAVYADPDDVNAWLEPLSRCVETGIRDNEAGRLRATQFSWTSAARSYLALLIDDPSGSSPSST
jgi:glycosyltransferase involved in cell wall biosynthesis